MREGKCQYCDRLQASQMQYVGQLWLRWNIILWRVLLIDWINLFWAAEWQMANRHRNDLLT